MSAETGPDLRDAGSENFTDLALALYEGRTVKGSAGFYFQAGAGTENKEACVAYI